jgi:hypothetical protein
MIIHALFTCYGFFPRVILLYESAQSNIKGLGAIDL